MPSKEEKDRRKALREAMDAKARAEFLEAMPMPMSIVRALVDHIDATVFSTSPDGAHLSHCDHTLSITRAFLEPLGHWSEEVHAWLGEQGGYCDCEVAYNVSGVCGD